MTLFKWPSILNLFRLMVKSCDVRVRRSMNPCLICSSHGLIVTNPAFCHFYHNNLKKPKNEHVKKLFCNNEIQSVKTVSVKWLIIYESSLIHFIYIFIYPLNCKKYGMKHFWMHKSEIMSAINEENAYFQRKKKNSFQN